MGCGQTMEGYCVIGKSLILFPIGPKCASKVISIFSLHPATHELPTIGGTERLLTWWRGSQCSSPGSAPSTWCMKVHRSGSGRAHQCILLGNKIQLFTSFLHGTAFWAVSLRAARSVCGCLKAMETTQREETLNGFSCQSLILTL